MIVDKYLEEIQYINEIKKRSVTAISRQTKISRATGVMATTVARKKNDPLYNRMMFHKKKWKEYKEKLLKKYSARVRSAARR